MPLIFHSSEFHFTVFFFACVHLVEHLLVEWNRHNLGECVPARRGVASQMPINVSWTILRPDSASESLFPAPVALFVFHCIYLVRADLTLGVCFSGLFPGLCSDFECNVDFMFDLFWTVGAAKR